LIRNKTNSGSRIYLHCCGHYLHVKCPEFLIINAKEELKSLFNLYTKTAGTYEINFVFVGLLMFALINY
jgi:hypothetical protein